MQERNQSNVQLMCRHMVYELLIPSKADFRDAEKDTFKTTTFYSYTVQAHSNKKMKINYEYGHNKGPPSLNNTCEGILLSAMCLHCILEKIRCSFQN